MNDRKFSEVFPDLSLSPAVDKMLHDVMVTRVVMYREKQRMELYLESTHLIEKEIIYRAEDEIRNHLFGPVSRFEVKIVERYLLSGAYTPEKLVELYMPSLLLELSRENHVSYRMVKRGGYSVSDQILRLSMANTDLARSREKEIRAFFENIFLTRFGMSISVSFSYTERKMREAEKRMADVGKKLPYTEGDEEVPWETAGSGDSGTDGKKSDDGKTFGEGKKSNSEAKDKTTKPGISASQVSSWCICPAE